MRYLFPLLIISVLMFLPKKVLADENANDSIDAQIQLALKYIDGDSVVADTLKGISILENLAKQGNTKAMYNLGRIYATINNKDIDKAIYWYTEASKYKYSPAQYELGQIYHHGDGVNQNHEIGLYWYRMAAMQNYCPAFKALYDAYLYGNGVEQNKKVAISYLKRAAETGDAEAQTTLGVKYDIGDVVSKNPQQAVYWYRKAAEKKYYCPIQPWCLLFQWDWYRKRFCTGSILVGKGC